MIFYRDVVHTAMLINGQCLRVQQIKVVKMCLDENIYCISEIIAVFL